MIRLIVNVRSSEDTGGVVVIYIRRLGGGGGGGSGSGERGSGDELEQG